MAAASMTPAQLLQGLQRGSYAPCYFLQGTAPYYIDQVMDYLEHRVLPAAARGLNLTVYFGRSHTLQEVLVAARSWPMLGERRVVLVKQAQDLKGLASPGGLEALLDYLEAPNPHTVLAFAYHGKVLDRRKASTKRLEAQAVVLTTRPLPAYRVPEWIVAYAGRLGQRLTPEAAVMLHTLLGEDLHLLAKQLDKLCAGYAGTDPIGVAFVREHVGLHRQFNLFELQKALATKEVPKVSRIAAHFAQNPTRYPLLKLLSVLTTFFSKLLQLHYLQARGLPALDAVAEVLQAHPYAVRAYLKALPHYTEAQLLEAITLLHRADRQAKGISYPAAAPGSILQELVAGLLLAPASPAA